MTLDEMIAQMVNPQEFTRLCNAIFTDIFGDGFQVIDGTRGDNGNDGYVAIEKRMLAIYCPIKPEQRTDAGIMAKIRSDLAKAAELKHAKKYEIDAWTFVTPRKLSDDVIQAMIKIAGEAGIRSSHQESTFLANQLYQRKHLLRGFPELQLLDLGEKIDEVVKLLKQRAEAPAAESNEKVEDKVPVSDEAGNVRFDELVEGVPTQEAKSELKAIAFKTTDPILEINVIIALLRWFDPADDDTRELVAFADRGVQRAIRSKLPDAEASLRASKAGVLVSEFSKIFIETYFSGIADVLVPWGPSPLGRRQERMARVRELEEQWKAEAGRAMEHIKVSRDYETVAGVLTVLGTNIGQLAHIFRIVGDKQNADKSLAQSKSLLMAAKDVYGRAGDEVGATNAIFNLANQIRWHGGEKEALRLVTSTIPVAEKHGDLMLLQKAKWLKETLESGVIPDYATGERRQWTVMPPAKK